MKRINTLSIVSTMNIVSILIISGCNVSPNKEGERWSHADLIQHLQKKGYMVQTEETHSGAFFGPAMYFRFNSNLGEDVYVQLRKSSQEARDEAGAKQGEAFSWGRFYFKGGSQDAQNKIKEALEIKTNNNITSNQQSNFPNIQPDASSKSVVTNGQMKSTESSNKTSQYESTNTNEVHNETAKINSSPCSEMTGAMEQLDCWEREYKKADTELNRIWRLIIANKTDVDKKKLINDQKIWLKQLESEAIQARGGNIDEVQNTNTRMMMLCGYYQNKSNNINKRIKEFNNMM